MWVGDNKIAAIGIHASRYITTHGIALNCNIDLSWFNHITPCGIEGKGVTSLSKETKKEFTIEKAMPIFLKEFQEVFQCESEELDINDQKDILSRVYSDLMAHITVSQ